LGTGQDGGTGIAVDGSGNAYLVGRTYSTNFPTTAGAFQRGNGGGLDTFVAKFNPSQSGTASLNLRNVAGITTSTDFPTTTGAFQTQYGGDNGVYRGDAFVAKLNATGTGLVYSTFLGGSGQDGATSIAVDAAGDADVAGMTRSTNFPTVNPIQAHKSSDPKKDFPNADTFVATLNPSGSGLLFSTYLGGTGGAVGPCLYHVAGDILSTRSFLRGPWQAGRPGTARVRLSPRRTKSARRRHASLARLAGWLARAVQEKGIMRWLQEPSKRERAAVGARKPFRACLREDQVSLWSQNRRFRTKCHTVSLLLRREAIV
jgi:hypothetical protein